jgi:hypothetical protein
MKLVGRKHWRSHVGARWGPTASPPPPWSANFFIVGFLVLSQELLHWN